MDSEKIAAFLQERWYIAALVAGLLALTGAVLNWDWLCDPTGAPRSHRYGRGSRRAIFFLLGAALAVAGIWGFALALK